MNDVSAAQAPPLAPRSPDFAIRPLLYAHRLSKSYRMGSTVLPVIRDCTLSVHRGEFIAIMGKSGSGKSTLLHLLGALDVPDEGQALFDDQPVFRESDRPGAAWTGSTGAWLRLAASLLLGCASLALLGLAMVSRPPLLSVQMALILLPALLAFFGAIAIPILAFSLSERARVNLRRRCFGFVFQFYHLLPELTVLENVLMTRMIGASVLSWWRGERVAARQAALQVLERVGLGERLKHRPSQLSGGERQRVAIARALVHKPAILFADEPTGNLDAAAGRKLVELLLELNRDGQTIVMVTHDPGVAGQANRVLYLEEGRLVTASQLPSLAPQQRR